MKIAWLAALLPAMALSQATGDFNADGNLDLAYFDQGAGGITVLLGDGHGGSTAKFAYQGGLEPTLIILLGESRRMPGRR